MYEVNGVKYDENNQKINTKQINKTKAYILYI